MFAIATLVMRTFLYVTQLAFALTYFHCSRYDIDTAISWQFLTILYFGKSVANSYEFKQCAYAPVMV